MQKRATEVPSEVLTRCPSTPPPPPSPPLQRSTPPVPVLPSNPADQQGYEEEYPPFCREEFRSVRFYNLPFEHKGPGSASASASKFVLLVPCSRFSSEVVLTRSESNRKKKWGVEPKLLNFFSENGVVYVALSSPASASIIFYSYHKLVLFFVLFLILAVSTAFEFCFSHKTVE